MGLCVDWTLAILFIFIFCATKGRTQNFFFKVYILIRREGVILMHLADILCIYILHWSVTGHILDWVGYLNTSGCLE